MFDRTSRTGFAARSALTGEAAGRTTALIAPSSSCRWRWRSSPRPRGAHRLNSSSVRDPLWREIRTLELFPGSNFGERIALPHLGTPAARVARTGRRAGSGGAARVRSPPSRWRGSSACSARDARAGWSSDPTHGPTPRLFTNGPAGSARSNSRPGSKARRRPIATPRPRPRGTGLHLRAAVALDHWLVYSHLVVGHFDQAALVRRPGGGEHRRHHAHRGELHRLRLERRGAGARSSAAIAGTGDRVTRAR